MFRINQLGVYYKVRKSGQKYADRTDPNSNVPVSSMIQTRQVPRGICCLTMNLSSSSLAINKKSLNKKNMRREFPFVLTTPLFESETDEIKSNAP